MRTFLILVGCAMRTFLTTNFRSGKVRDAQPTNRACANFRRVRIAHIPNTGLATNTPLAENFNSPFFPKIDPRN